MVKAEAATSAIYYSIWKTLLVELIVWPVTVFALVPWTAEGSRFTALYKDPFLYGLLIICGLYLIFLSLWFLRVVWRAFMRRPAIEIQGDRVRVYGARVREFSLSSIVRCQTQFGKTVVFTKEGERITVPIVMLSDGDRFAADLERYCRAAA